MTDESIDSTLRTSLKAFAALAAPATALNAIFPKKISMLVTIGAAAAALLFAAPAYSALQDERVLVSQLAAAQQAAIPNDSTTLRDVG